MSEDVGRGRLLSEAALSRAKYRPRSGAAASPRGKRGRRRRLVAPVMAPSRPLPRGTQRTVRRRKFFCRRRRGSAALAEADADAQGHVEGREGPEADRVLVAQAAEDAVLLEADVVAEPRRDVDDVAAWPLAEADADAQGHVEGREGPEADRVLVAQAAEDAVLLEADVVGEPRRDVDDDAARRLSPRRTRTRRGMSKAAKGRRPIECSWRRPPRTRSSSKRMSLPNRGAMSTTSRLGLSPRRTRTRRGMSKAAKGRRPIECSWRRPPRTRSSSKRMSLPNRGAMSTTTRLGGSRRGGRGRAGACRRPRRAGGRSSARGAGRRGRGPPRSGCRWRTAARCRRRRGSAALAEADADAQGHVEGREGPEADRVLVAQAAEDAVLLEADVVGEPRRDVDDVAAWPLAEADADAQGHVEGREGPEADRVLVAQAAEDAVLLEADVVAEPRRDVDDDAARRLSPRRTRTRRGMSKAAKGRRPIECSWRRPPRTRSSSKRMSLPNRGAMSTTSRLGRSPRRTRTRRGMSKAAKGRRPIECSWRRPPRTRSSSKRMSLANRGAMSTTSRLGGSRRGGRGRAGACRRPRRAGGRSSARGAGRRGRGPPQSGCRCRTAARCRRRRGLASRRGGRGRAGACRRPRRAGGRSSARGAGRRGRGPPRSGCRCRTAARCRRRRGLASRRGGRGRAGACRRPRRAGGRSSARGAGRRGRGPPRSGCRCRTAARCRRRRRSAALAEADADAQGHVEGREGPEADRVLVAQAAEDAVLLEADVVAEPRRDVDDVAAWPLAEADADAQGHVEGREGPEADRVLVAQAAEDAVLLEANVVAEPRRDVDDDAARRLSPRRTRTRRGMSKAAKGRRPIECSWRRPPRTRSSSKRMSLANRGAMSTTSPLGGSRRGGRGRAGACRRPRRAGGRSSARGAGRRGRGPPRSGCRCRTAARCRRRRGLAARRGGRGRAGACRRPRRAGGRSSARGAGRRGRGPPRSGCRWRTAARCRRRRGSAALAEADADAQGHVEGREGPEADRVLVAQAAEDAVLLEANVVAEPRRDVDDDAARRLSPRRTRTRRGMSKAAKGRRPIECSWRRPPRTRSSSKRMSLANRGAMSTTSPLGGSRRGGRGRAGACRRPRRAGGRSSARGAGRRGRGPPRSGCRCRTAARCRRRRGLAARRGGRGRAGACRRPRRAGGRSSARGAGRRGRGPPRSGCRWRTAARCRRRRGSAALAEADADAQGHVEGREGPEADRVLVAQAAEDAVLLEADVVAEPRRDVDDVAARRLSPRRTRTRRGMSKAAKGRRPIECSWRRPPRTRSSSKRMSLPNRGAMSTTSRLGRSPRRTRTRRGMSKAAKGRRPIECSWRRPPRTRSSSKLMSLPNRGAMSTTTRLGGSRRGGRGRAGACRRPRRAGGRSSARGAGRRGRGPPRSGCRWRTAARCRRRRRSAALAEADADAQGHVEGREGPEADRVLVAQAAEDAVLLEADVVAEPRRDVDDVAAWPLAEADADAQGHVEGREGPEADRVLVAQAAEDAVLLEADVVGEPRRDVDDDAARRLSPRRTRTRRGMSKAAKGRRPIECSWRRPPRTRSSSKLMSLPNRGAMSTTTRLGGSRRGGRGRAGACRRPRRAGGRSSARGAGRRGRGPPRSGCRWRTAARCRRRRRSAALAEADADAQGHVEGREGPEADRVLVAQAAEDAVLLEADVVAEPRRDVDDVAAWPLAEADADAQGHVEGREGPEADRVLVAQAAEDAVLLEADVVGEPRRDVDDDAARRLSPRRTRTRRGMSKAAKGRRPIECSWRRPPRTRSSSKRMSLANRGAMSTTTRLGGSRRGGRGRAGACRRPRRAGGRSSARGAGRRGRGPPRSGCRWRTAARCRRRRGSAALAEADADAQGHVEGREGPEADRVLVAQAAEDAVLLEADVVAEPRRDVDDVAAWPLAEADADAQGHVEGREGPEADRVLVAQAAEDAVLLEADVVAEPRRDVDDDAARRLSPRRTRTRRGMSKAAKGRRPIECSWRRPPRTRSSSKRMSLANRGAMSTTTRLGGSRRGGRGRAGACRRPRRAGGRSSARGAGRRGRGPPRSGCRWRTAARCRRRRGSAALAEADADAQGHVEGREGPEADRVLVAQAAEDAVLLEADVVGEPRRDVDDDAARRRSPRRTRTRRGMSKAAKGRRPIECSWRRPPRTRSSSKRMSLPNRGAMSTTTRLGGSRRGGRGRAGACRRPRRAGGRSSARGAGRRGRGPPRSGCRCRTAARCRRRRGSAALAEADADAQGHVEGREGPEADRVLVAQAAEDAVLLEADVVGEPRRDVDDDAARRLSPRRTRTRRGMSKAAKGRRPIECSWRRPPRTRSSSKRMSLANRGAMSTTSRLGRSPRRTRTRRGMSKAAKGRRPIECSWRRPPRTRSSSKRMSLPNRGAMSTTTRLGGSRRGGRGRAGACRRPRRAGGRSSARGAGRRGRGPPRSGCRCRTAARCRRRRGSAALAEADADAQGHVEGREGPEADRVLVAQAAEDAVLLEADVVAEPRRDVDDVAAWPLAEADADAQGHVEGREGPEADRVLVAQAAEDAVLLEADVVAEPRRDVDDDAARRLSPRRTRTRRGMSKAAKGRRPIECSWRRPPRTRSSSKRMSLPNRGAMSTTSRLGRSPRRTRTRRGMSKAAKGRRPIECSWRRPPRTRSSSKRMSLPNRGAMSTTTRLGGSRRGGRGRAGACRRPRRAGGRSSARGAGRRGRGPPRSGCRWRTAARCRRRRGSAALAEADADAQGHVEGREGPEADRVLVAQAAEDAVLLEADVVAEPRRDVDDVAAWPLAEADADAQGHVEGREGPEADRVLVAQAAEDAVLLEADVVAEPRRDVDDDAARRLSPRRTRTRRGMSKAAKGRRPIECSWRRPPRTRSSSKRMSLPNRGAMSTTSRLGRSPRRTRTRRGMSKAAKGRRPIECSWRRPPRTRSSSKRMSLPNRGAMSTTSRLGGSRRGGRGRAGACRRPRRAGGRSSARGAGRRGRGPPRSGCRCRTAARCRRRRGSAALAEADADAQGHVEGREGPEADRVLVAQAAEDAVLLEADVVAEPRRDVDDDAARRLSPRRTRTRRGMSKAAKGRRPIECSWRRPPRTRSSSKRMSLPNRGAMSTTSPLGGSRRGGRGRAGACRRPRRAGGRSSARGAGRRGRGPPRSGCRCRTAARCRRRRGLAASPRRTRTRRGMSKAAKGRRPIECSWRRPPRTRSSLKLVARSVRR